ncbi:hypothetical protein D1AOALGA4SA_6003 [Olavius algarvensis Delta 1 endosymbiont]|nr:hypothetical protein D1AOALGA4SA_6003 [Olavius algarvensis Delta 1 endosymbiont]
MGAVFFRSDWTPAASGRAPLKLHRLLQKCSFFSLIRLAVFFGQRPHSCETKIQNLELILF